MGVRVDYGRKCGVQTPRMKGPCEKWRGHETASWDDGRHRSAPSENYDTPKLREFARVVNEALDHGVQLSYVEIAEVMGHKNVRSVAHYGMGGRFTKLRDRIYREHGVTPDNHRRSAEQSAAIVANIRGDSR